MATSSVIRHVRQTQTPLDPLDRAAMVHAVDGDTMTSTMVRMAYLDERPAADDERATIVLLHGSPGRKEEFGSLAQLLARNARVVVPDLPGFGASTMTLPDYSFHAHALYVRQLLDRMGVRRVHVLGYSMGGGVALSLADAAPDRVKSLTMLSAIGVQEMELTGDYYVNHAVHAVQLAALWMAREGTPHMGFFDRAMLGVPYARNFFDSDQRPLRAVLRRINVPTLIIHGADDPQVPIEAALEHYRLVPQSELMKLTGNHFLVFNRTADVSTAVSAFMRRVEEGRAATRPDANPERIRLAASPVGPATLPRVRGIAAFVVGGLLAVSASAFASVASVAAGMFVAGGRVSPVVAVVACVIGAIVARRKFPLVAIVTSAMRSMFYVGASAVLCSVLFRVTPFAFINPYGRAAIVVALVTCGLRLSLAAATDRGRRLLVSVWRRTTRWEFWPPWIFYLPVVVYVVYLMAKHRSATLFTAANPGILAGGFVGESKHDILQRLSGAGGYVARSCLINGSLGAAGKLLAVERFMVDHRLTFPVVLKPNCGQRGSGVVVVRSLAALERALARSSVDIIVQEYVRGDEFGVFYFRRPSEARGHIFSVTEKRFPTVVGDGRRTLETLILHDERAVCAARLYLERHRASLSTVPAHGEVVALAELGTHCRGALFLNGSAIMSPALEERFETIAESFDGFFFGRFDVRVDGGIDALRDGHGFKIIELNGVTSEATHIYEPGTPLAAAYRVLMRQWEIAFEIGAENRRRGVAPTSMWTLMQLGRDYVRTSRHHLPESLEEPTPTSLQEARAVDLALR